jgi:hypothetical protein
LYINIEELAEHLSVSVSTIRTWLKSGFFSQDAFFSVNTVQRFKLEVVLKELHSENFGKEENDSSLEHRAQSTPDANTIISSDYETLVTDLFKMAYGYYKLLSRNQYTLNQILDEFTLETRNGDYSFEIGQDLLSILESYNLNDVVSQIRARIIECYVDSDDRAQILDGLGILVDIGTAQVHLKSKLNELNSKEQSIRERALEKLGLTSNMMDDLHFNEDEILETLSHVMLEPSAGIPPDSLEKIVKLRRSAFSTLIDFDTGDIYL